MYFLKDLHARALLCLLFLVSTALMDYSRADEFSPDSHTREVMYGRGYNSGTGVISGQCAESGATMTFLEQGNRPGFQVNADGQSVRMDMKFVETFSSLRRVLDLDAKASFGIGMFAGDARVSFLSESATQHHSVFFYIYNDVINQSENLVHLALTRDASDLLVRDPVTFQGRCGNQFISGRTTGGYFVAILEVVTTDEADKSDVKAALRAGGPDWSSQAEAQTELERVSRSHTIHYSVFKNGSNVPFPDASPAAIMAAATTFPREVSLREGQPSVRFVTTTSYDSIVNRPDGDLMDVREQIRTLNWLSEKRDEVLDKVRSISSILETPPAYENHDPAQMRILRSNYNSILGVIVEAAQLCGENLANCRRPAIIWPTTELSEKRATINSRVRAIQNIFFKCKKDKGVPANEGENVWHHLDLNTNHGGRFIYCGYQIKEGGDPIKRIGFISTKDPLHGENLVRAMKASGFEKCDAQDLNEGAKGKFIYMGWSKTGNDQPIEALDFVETGENHPPQRGDWVPIHQDLCEGCGGSYIWCYYKRHNLN